MVTELLLRLLSYLFIGTFYYLTLVCKVSQFGIELSHDLSLYLYEQQINLENIALLSVTTIGGVILVSHTLGHNLLSLYMYSSFLVHNRIFLVFPPSLFFTSCTSSIMSFTDDPAKLRVFSTGVACLGRETLLDLSELTAGEEVSSGAQILVALTAGCSAL